jgi:NAD(P)-dependent dehydrogenase (short-subunit alcohol dehydrogenase family)
MNQRKIIITGALGGMGRACARLFGASHDLVLTDLAEAPLHHWAEELRSEGAVVTSTCAGDLGDPDLLNELAEEFDGVNPFVLIHTAGLSPALADWRAIMSVNLIATERLLRMVDPRVAPQSVGILIASMAGHLSPHSEEAEALLAAPLADGFLEKMGVYLDSAAGEANAASLSYMLSKRAVLALCERRAADWGKRGARILSISPGLIMTPMGQKEIQETPGVDVVMAATPLARAGRPMDIALAAHFLASNQAGFITGCDLRIDGGSTAAARAMQAAGDVGSN